MYGAEQNEALRETLKQPEILQDLEDIKQALVFARKHNNKPTDEKSINEEAGKLQQQTDDGKCVFYAIKNELEEIITTGCLQKLSCRGDFEDYYGKGDAYICDQAVQPEFRGKKFGPKQETLAETINNLRLGKAFEMGSKYVYTEINHNNLRSLISKFKDGFIVTNFHRNDENPEVGGCFVARKRTDKKPEFDQKENLGDLQEVPLDDLQTIFDMLEKESWVGIDIKNDDQNPTNWSLILEKGKKEYSPGATNKEHQQP